MSEVSDGKERLPRNTHKSKRRVDQHVAFVFVQLSVISRSDITAVDVSLVDVK